MFGWLRRDPVVRVQQQYLRKLRQAREAEGAGDAVLAAILFDEADELAGRLDALRQEQGLVSA